MSYFLAGADVSCAIITPSFRTDFEQCRLLAETVRAHVAPHVKHYLTVDRRDGGQFAELAGPRTEILYVEDVVPWWIRRLPFARRWWMSLKTPPIRNWMLQQIVKLSVAKFIPADILIFVDSDVFFVRPYDPMTLVRGGKVPLFREYGEELRCDFNRRWHRVGAKLFGLPPQDDYLTSYVGNIITWRAENVRLLHDHIEKVTGRSWIRERLAPSRDERVRPLWHVLRARAQGAKRPLLRLQHQQSLLLEDAEARRPRAPGVPR